jgi:hypothetical protein
MLRPNLPAVRSSTRAPRSAALGASASLLLLATFVGGPPRPEASAAKDVNLRPAAAVARPPSTELLLAEVVTGGASASDEYVEITNAGAVPVDMTGMERVYVASLGSGVIREVTWIVGDPARIVREPA